GAKVDFNQYGVRIFTLDYPNYFDRLEKKTGNGIWLHAIPDEKSLQRGSHGCVVVRNKVIEQLAPYIDLKRTPIVIADSIDYLDEPAWRELRQSLREWLEGWRKSWGTKNLDDYMAQYSDRFRSNHMDKAAWRRYKQSLADKYKFIDVNISEV